MPGAGLGRLVYEVAKRGACVDCLYSVEDLTEFALVGFSAQGNEFSHYMLFPSFYILNRFGDRNHGSDFESDDDTTGHSKRMNIQSILTSTLSRTAEAQVF